MMQSSMLGSMDIGKEVTKQGFPLDLLHKLMVCCSFPGMTMEAAAEQLKAACEEYLQELGLL